MRLAGLYDHMVLQRDHQNVSAAAFSGRCGANGPVVATVLRQGCVLDGFSARHVGQAEVGRLFAVLAGRSLPVFGPVPVL